MKNEIIEATKTNDITRVQQLIKQNAAAVYEHDGKGYSAIAWAAQKGHLEIFKILLDAGADLHDTNNENKASLLHMAAQGANLIIASTLISKGVTSDIDQKTKDGWNAMQLAVIGKNPEIIALLKAQGSKTDPDYFFFKRQLSFIFGSTLKTPKIFSYFKEIPAGGNFHKDTLPIINATLEKFINSQKDIKAEKYKPFLFALESFTQKKPIDATVIEKNQPILLETGHDEHYIPAYLEPYSNDNWQLSIYDRGDFSSFLAPNHSNEYFRKFPTAAQIIVQKENLLWLIEKLKYAFDSDRDTSKKILFTEIPLQLNKKYSLAELPLQKLSSANNCYYANFQSLMAHQFVKNDGYFSGLVNYKKWDKSVHKYVLEAYDEYCDQHPNVEEISAEIVAHCENITEEKLDKLNILKTVITIPDISYAWQITATSEKHVELKLNNFHLSFKATNQRDNSWLLEISGDNKNLSAYIISEKDIRIMFCNINKKNINDLIGKLLNGSYEEQKIAHAIKNEIINHDERQSENISTAIKIMTTKNYLNSMFAENLPVDNETTSVPKLGS